jgi:hypothetical protein
MGFMDQKLFDLASLMLGVSALDRSVPMNRNRRGRAGRDMIVREPLAAGAKRLPGVGA